MPNERCILLCKLYRFKFTEFTNTCKQLSIAPSQ